MRRPDAEIFRENVLRYKPKKMKLQELEEKVGYVRGHLYRNARNDCSVTVDHIRSYSKALGVDPPKLLEGMFDK